MAEPPDLPPDDIESRPAEVVSRDWGALRDIPFLLTLEIGRARMCVRDLLALDVGSLVTTDKLSGEPMDLSLDGRVFAASEIIIIKDKLWARLTKVVGGEP